MHVAYCTLVPVLLQTIKHYIMHSVVNIILFSILPDTFKALYYFNFLQAD